MRMSNSGTDDFSRPPFTSNDVAPVIGGGPTRAAAAAWFENMWFTILFMFGASARRAAARATAVCMQLLAFSYVPVYDVFQYMTTSKSLLTMTRRQWSAVGRPWRSSCVLKVPTSRLRHSFELRVQQLVMCCATPEDCANQLPLKDCQLGNHYALCASPQQSPLSPSSPCTVCFNPLNQSHKMLAC